MGLSSRTAAGAGVLPSNEAMIRPRPTPSLGSRAAAVGTLLIGMIYGVSPIDLIPDVIPLLGWSDDAAVMLTALFIAWRFWRSRRAARVR